jgi:predicted NBD/HSP70 family sugar kinase
MPKKVVSLSKSHRLILRLLAGAGLPASLSRAKLCDLMQMSTPGVSRLVQDLISWKIVVEVGLLIDSKKIGRPQTTLALNERIGYFYTIHIDSDSTQLSIVRISGKVLIQKKLASNFLQDPSLFFADIVGQLVEMADHISLSKNKILGTGLTMACQLDTSNRIALADLIFWHKNVAIYDILQPMLAHNLSIAPRLHALGLTHLLYSSTPSDHLYAIDWGSSIRGISILNKSIYCGENSSRSSLAHYSVDTKGKLCHCGKRGCLQQYLSQWVLLSQWHDEVANLGDVHFEQMLQAASQAQSASDKVAHQLLQQATHYLALSIQAVMSILNSEQILLFGENFQNDYIYHQLVKAIHQLEHNFPIQKLHRSRLIDDNPNLAAHTLIVSDTFF